MNRLKNKVALVTGGTSGIGEKITDCFIAEGATVVVCDINQEALNKAKGKENVVTKKLDISSEAEWTQVVQEVIEQFGKIDILANNAGISSDKGLETTTVE